MIAAIFVVYARETTANYRQLRTNEISSIVNFESERVGIVVAEMERNAVDLALAGRQFYQGGEHPEMLGVSVSVENFSAFTSAVGGGIWYAPYAIDPDIKRVCYYAFFDPDINSVRHDSDFETEEYDYHTQMWYVTISAGVNENYNTVWTEPYYDDAGTNALMTTVGSGIYNENNQLVGISTVDWEIQSMVDRLSAIKPTENSFVLLASPKDDYIISNTYVSGTDQAGMSLLSLPWYNELQFSQDGTISIGQFINEGVEYMSFSRLFNNGWLFSVQIPANEIYAEIETQNMQFLAIIAFLFAILLAIAAFLLSRLINRPLGRLTSGVAELGGGNLDKQIEVRSKDEFGTLAKAFNKMTVDLKESIEQHARERAEKERIGAELDVATKIQANMLPSIFPPFPDRIEFDIYASMRPAKEVGGDFYDFFLIDERTLAVVMADVSGKGIPAALFMVIAKTLIKNNAQYGKTPKEVFETVNNLLCENNEAAMFVTAFLGYLDIPSGKFTYVNAGHNHPFIRGGDQYKPLKEKPGFVLAGMENMPYKQYEIVFQPGDELFLYTDGVTEAANNENILFGESRLVETINNNCDLPLCEFDTSIKQEIEKFAEGAEQADDITMLVLRYKGQETDE